MEEDFESQQSGTDENDGTPEYSLKSDFSKPKLVEEASRKIMEFRSKEMKKGYFNFTKTTDGEENKTWVPDSRRQFISAVEALKGLLYPEIQRAVKIKKVVKGIEGEKKKLFAKWSVRKRVVKESAVTETGEPYMPEEDEFVPIVVKEKTAYAWKFKQEDVKGMWNNRVWNYWEGLIELYDQLFENLMQLVDNLNYFKQGASF